MTIHKEGYSTLFVVLVALLLVNAGVYFLLGIEVTKFSALASVLFYFLVVNFFRSPKRDAVIQDGAVIASADGKIVAIEEVFEDEYLKTKSG